MMLSVLRTVAECLLYSTAVKWIFMNAIRLVYDDDVMHFIGFFSMTKDVFR